MKVIICDIDNCIADDGWRLPYIEWDKQGDARYHAYHSMSVQDKPWTNWLKDNIQHYKPDQVHFFTSRNLTYRGQTEYWLANVAKLDPSMWDLHMRNVGDARRSVKLKSDMLTDLMEQHDLYTSDIVAAYDDRQDIVDMYKAHGLLGVVVSKIHDNTVWEGTDAPPASVPDLLRKAAATYEQRNAVYGDNYKRVGDVMAALFPNGIHLETAAQFNQWHLFELMVVKMTRFTNSKMQHVDSIHDHVVYGAMVQSLVKEGTFK